MDIQTTLTKAALVLIGLMLAKQIALQLKTRGGVNIFV